MCGGQSESNSAGHMETRATSFFDVLIVKQDHYTRRECAVDARTALTDKSQAFQRSKGYWKGMLPVAVENIAKTELLCRMLTATQDASTRMDIQYTWCSFDECTAHVLTPTLLRVSSTCGVCTRLMLACPAPHAPMQACWPQQSTPPSGQGGHRGQPAARSPGLWCLHSGEQACHLRPVLECNQLVVWVFLAACVPSARPQTAE